MNPANPTYPQLTPRQKAREMAFQFLYQLDQTKGSMAIGEIEAEFKIHADHFNTAQLSRDFALRLVKQTLSSLDAIDAVITSHAENWRIDRIGAIEKAFLRMGAAELIYFKDVPASVTLNEVIELSKYFGEAETPAFLNGILDPISRDPQATEGKVLSE